MFQQAGPHSAEDYAAFVGKRVYTYVPKFGLYAARPAAFHPGWNWAAFSFTFWWFLYRKMYMWAAVSFVVFCLPVPHLFSMIAWGVAANFLYYRHSTAKISDLKMYHGDSYALFLKPNGGVNGWVPLVALLVAGAFAVLAFLGFVSLALLTSSWQMWWFTAPPVGTPI